MSRNTRTQRRVSVAARVLCVLSCVALTMGVPVPMKHISPTVNAITYSSDDDLILRYNTEAGKNSSGNAWDNDESFYKALPLGNGRIGAMVYGNCPTEHFDLNEATFWSGGPGSNDRYGAADQLDTVQDMMRRGSYKDADGVIGSKMIGGGEARYQSVGYLDLSFGHSNVSGYSRQLDMNTAVSSCDYTFDGKQYHRESFVSYPDQVLVTRITCSAAGSVSLTAGYDCSLTWQFSVETDGADTMVMNGHGDKDLGIEGAVYFSSRTKLIPDGGKVSAADNRISVSGADSVTILTAIRTNFVDYKTCNGDEKGNAKRDLDAAAKKSYKEIYANHLADYQELFKRVDIELGGDGSNNLTPMSKRIADFGTNNDPKLAEVLFQYGRYLMISASRDSEPMNLQGIWNKFREPAWGCKYTTNINYEMNYWPAFTTNLSECFDPFVEKAKSLQKMGEQTAKVQYGISTGWVLHHNTDLWCRTGPIDGSWGMWPTGGAWVSNMLYDAYSFNQDENYLNEVYPIIKGSSDFLSALLEEYKVNDRTYLMIGPSTSPEVATPAGSGGQGANCAFGITMDNAICRDLFRGIIDAANALGTDSTMRGTLQSQISRLKPDTVGSWGQLQEWAFDWDSKSEKNRHISQVYSLFPGSLITVDSTPQLADAAKVSLNARGDDGTGWSEAWKLNCWARLCDGEHAYNLVRLLISPINNYGRLYDNLWDAHPPFQIDGNFGFTSGVAEMLLQSQDNEIKLLPALPKVWGTGHANGLCARGGFEVSEMNWANGKLTSVTILSNSGNTCTLVYNGSKISFDTKAGESYTFNGILEPADEIDELTNIALGKKVTASGSEVGEEASAAVDGSSATKWCDTGASGSKWISVDLGKSCDISRWVVKLAGVQESVDLNARDFTFQYSDDETTWLDADRISGNQQNITARNIKTINARYVRLLVNLPTQTDADGARVYEFEVWGKGGEPAPALNPYITVEAEAYSAQSGVQTEECELGGRDVGFIENGDYIVFRNVDFANGAYSFSVNASSPEQGGAIELHLDAPDGELAGTCEIGITGDWQEWDDFTCDVDAKGKHTLYLVFTGGEDYLFNVNNFVFLRRGDIATDGKLTEDDVEVLKLFILGKGKLLSEYNTAADCNGDGKINAADLSELIGFSCK